MGGYKWPDKILQLVIERWRTPGVSASEICYNLARHHGVTISRNAVIGKMAREGVFCGTPQPQSAGGKKSTGVVHPWNRRPAKAKRTPPVEVSRVPDATAPAPLHLTVQALREKHCRWPYGDGPFTFCGHERSGEKPYCSYHWAKSHQ